MRPAERRLTILLCGGYARSLVNFRGPLIRALVAGGHDVVACAPAGDSEERRAVERLGARFHAVELSRTGMNPLADVSTIDSIRDACRRFRPDIFLGYTAKPVIYGSIAARLAGVRRRVSMVTGLGYAFAQGGLRGRALLGTVRWLYRLALRGNECVFFQNPDDLQVFLGGGLIRPPTRAVLINGSGVDLERFAPAPLPSGTSFLLIARLLADKGIREYVRAAEQVRRRNPGVSFHLVGPLDSNPAAIRPDELDGWVRGGAIRYWGALDDVREALVQASVYVLPSYREGTPRTVLEAMAMGRPVITTDAPGCRETVEDGVNGFLVPPRDADSLAAAMERFAVDPSLAARMGEESLRIAREKYDVHRVNAVILDALGLASTPGPSDGND